MLCTIAISPTIEALASPPTALLHLADRIQDPRVESDRHKSTTKNVRTWVNYCTSSALT
jgi:hypothetical protein